jgi:hypothetical protein
VQYLLTIFLIASAGCRFDRSYPLQSASEVFGRGPGTFVQNVLGNILNVERRVQSELACNLEEREKEAAGIRT